MARKRLINYYYQKEKEVKMSSRARKRAPKKVKEVTDTLYQQVSGDEKA